jgi:hypothetical protein
MLSRRILSFSLVPHSQRKNLSGDVLGRPSVHSQRLCLHKLNYRIRDTQHLPLLDAFHLCPK